VAAFNTFRSTSAGQGRFASDLGVLSRLLDSHGLVAILPELARRYFRDNLDHPAMQAIQPTESAADLSRRVSMTDSVSPTIGK
jgi:hypothetical protein